MNLKRFFGALLTLSGIGGFLYTVVAFTETIGGTRDVKELIIYSVLRIVFFTSGLVLFETLKTNPNCYF